MTTVKEHYGVKTVVLGRYATGKSSMISRLVYGTFDATIQSTIGCAFMSINHTSSTGVPVQYQIWDTAGQERYKSMMQMYYKRADVIMICFDVSDPNALDSVREWLQLVKDGCDHTDYILFLVANKNDLEWMVCKETMNKFAEENKMTFVVTSALLDQGINDLFNEITSQTDTRWRDEMLARKDRIILDKPPKPSRCCYI